MRSSALTDLLLGTPMSPVQKEFAETIPERRDACRPHQRHPGFSKIEVGSAAARGGAVLTSGIASKARLSLLHAARQDSISSTGSGTMFHAISPVTSSAFARSSSTSSPMPSNSQAGRVSLPQQGAVRNQNGGSRGTLHFGPGQRNRNPGRPAPPWHWALQPGGRFNDPEIQGEPAWSLAICQRLVTDPDGGTDLGLILREGSRGQVGASLRVAAEPQSQSAPPQHPPLPGRRILLVGILIQPNSAFSPADGPVGILPRPC